MPGLRCIAVDPNEADLAQLRYLLESNARISQVGIVQDLSAASAVLERNAADAVFICLAKHTPAQLLEFASLPWRPKIVAVAPSDEYAKLAFDIGAIDFMVKPIPAASVSRAVSRLVDSGCCHAVDPRTYRVAISRDEALHFVDPRDIYYIETEGDYTRIFSSHGSDACRLSLSALTEQLAPLGFVRVHRKWLVSVSKISAVTIDERRVFVQVGQARLPVARRQLAEVRSRLI